MLVDLVPHSGGAVPLTPVTQAALPALLASLGAGVERWAEATRFAAEPGKFLLLPDEAGRLGRVLVGRAEGDPLWALAGCPDALPEATYALDGAAGADPTRLALGWALGTYVFTRYKRRERGFARLEWPAAADRPRVEALAAAFFLARDLINTPAEDLGPEELAGAVEDLAARAGGRCRIIAGEALLGENYPAIHAVGRASTRAPRLVDLAWGDASAPKLTLVGKGVCFDSGGLDLKPSSGMRLMKKDMGGAATLIGLAQRGDGAALAGAAAPPRAGGGEFGRGQRLPPARRAAHAQGHHRRGRQHRCRGPARAMRCADRSLRRAARPADRHGDAHRRGTGGARPRAAGPLRQ